MTGPAKQTTQSIEQLIVGQYGVVLGGENLRKALGIRSATSFSRAVSTGNLGLNFVRLASIGGHQLMYHPASVSDFERDPNLVRRQHNLERIRQHPAL
jgi:hypothetical protein